MVLWHVWAILKIHSPLLIDFLESLGEEPVP